jgi:ER membrane protein complex subunit 3
MMVTFRSSLLLLLRQHLARIRTLRSSCNMIPYYAFDQRRQLLAERIKSGAYLATPASAGEQPAGGGDGGAQPPPPNPMGDPAQMDLMMEGMKKNMAMMIPQMVMMGWINYFFSGFVLSKFPV